MASSYSCESGSRLPLSSEVFESQRLAELLSQMEDPGMSFLKSSRGFKRFCFKSISRDDLKQSVMQNKGLSCGCIPKGNAWTILC